MELYGQEVNGANYKHYSTDDLNTFKVQLRSDIRDLQKKHNVSPEERVNLHEKQELVTYIIWGLHRRSL